MELLFNFSVLDKIGNSTDAALSLLILFGIFVLVSREVIEELLSKCSRSSSTFNEPRSGGGFNKVGTLWHYMKLG